MFIPSRCQGPVSIAIAVCQKLSNAAWTKLVVACATQQHCKLWMLFFSLLWNETRGTGRETPDTFTIDNWSILFWLISLNRFCLLLVGFSYWTDDFSVTTSLCLASQLNPRVASLRPEERLQEVFGGDRLPWRQVRFVGSPWCEARWVHYCSLPSSSISHCCDAENLTRRQWQT